MQFYGITEFKFEVLYLAKYKSDSDESFIRQRSFSITSKLHLFYNISANNRKNIQFVYKQKEGSIQKKILRPA